MLSKKENGFHQGAGEMERIKRHLSLNRGRQARFVSRVTTEISFHFVHLFNAKDLRQIGWVREMK
jgi:hypothetical protein